MGCDEQIVGPDQCAVQLEIGTYPCLLYTSGGVCIPVTQLVSGFSVEMGRLIRLPAQVGAEVSDKGLKGPSVSNQAEFCLGAWSGRSGV